MSQATENLFGYAYEKLINDDKPFYDYYTAESKEYIFNTIIKEIAEKVKRGEISRFMSEFEATVVQKDGTLIPVEIFASATNDKEGNLIEFYGATRNIEERKKSEAKILEQNIALEQANATKDRFFSIIAHDLKNPISSLHKMGELLNMDYDALEKSIENKECRELKELHSDIELLNEASKQAYQLLENLLE
jgi:PAS domain S-box-containing protein